jgi:hypothetical protein
MSSTAGRINSKAGCNTRYGYAKDQAAKELNGLVRPPAMIMARASNKEKPSPAKRGLFLVTLCTKVCRDLLRGAIDAVGCAVPDGCALVA